jgi:hypothetical protein
MSSKKRDEEKKSWPTALTVDQPRGKSGTLFSSEPSLIQGGYKVNVEGFSLREILHRSPFLPIQPGQDSLKMDHQALQLAIRMAAVQVALEMSDPAHLRERSQDEDIRKKTDELRKRGLAALFNWTKKEDQKAGGNHEG